MKRRFMWYLSVFAGLAFLTMGAGAQTPTVTPTATCDVCLSSQSVTAGSGGVFNGPYGLAIDQTNGVLYVADTGNNEVQEFNLNNGNTITNEGTSIKGFTQPMGINFSNGYLYVGEYGGWVKMTPSGTPVNSVTLPNQVQGLWVDVNGDVYAVDSAVVTVFQPNISGGVTTYVPATTNITGLGTDIVGVLVAGNILYFSDNQYPTSTSHITMFMKLTESPGSISFSAPTTVANNGILGASSSPFQLVMDSANRLYVPGYFSFIYQVFDINENTGALTFDHSCSPGYEPTGMAFDAQGNLYVSGRAPDQLNKFAFCNVQAPAPSYPGSNPPGTGECFVYPSPARGDHATVSYKMEEPGNITLRIWNEKAELVDTVTDSKSSPGVQTTPFTVAGYATGVYFYSLVLNYGSGNSQKIGPQKFVVIH